MLVLSRNKNESIMIGDNIEVTIVDVRGNRVCLGITAPKEIPVHRREIYDAIQREIQREKEQPKCKTCRGRGEIPDDFDSCGGVAGACVEIMHMNSELMKPCPDCQVQKGDTPDQTTDSVKN